MDRPCTNRHPHGQHRRDEPGQPHDGAWCPGMPLDRRREWAAATADVADAVAVHAHHYRVASPGELATLIRQRADRIAAGKLTPWADGAEPAAPRPDVDAAAPTGPGTSTDTPTAQEGAQAAYRDLIVVLTQQLLEAVRERDAARVDLDAHRGALRRASGDRDQAMIELLAARDQLQHEQDQTALAHAQLAEQQRELDRLRAEVASQRTTLNMQATVLALRQDEADQARAEVERMREEAVQFSARLGFGDNMSAAATPLLDMLDPIAEAMAAARDHDECPTICEGCGDPLAATLCQRCHGVGDIGSTAHQECPECAGAGKIHEGCAGSSYGQLVAELAELRAHAEAADNALADWKHNLALRAFTAPDADLDTILSSLDSRISDLSAALMAAVDQHDTTTEES